MAEVETYMKGDIFSYGLVLHYMLTGDKPWATQESHAAGVERTFVAFPDYPENLGEEPLQDLYDDCLQWEPDHRLGAREIINKKFQGKAGS